MKPPNAPSGKALHPIRDWWGGIESRWWKTGSFAFIVALGVYFAFFFGWGRWPPIAELSPWSKPLSWHAVWETEPAQGADLDVLTALLGQNREEVRFWQGVLFQVSLAYIAGILGIVSLGLKMEAASEWLRWTYAIAIVFLVAFYLIFVKVAENAIALNHKDLTGIEIALKLSKKGAFIDNEIIYDHNKKNQEEGKGERLIQQLVPFGVSLGVLSVFAVLFVPILPQADRKD